MSQKPINHTQPKTNNKKRTTEEVASIICKALAFSNLTEDYDYISSANPNSLDETISIDIINDYIIHQKEPKKKNLLVVRQDFNDLLAAIYERAPLNFCMSLNKRIYENNEDYLLSMDTLNVLLNRFKFEDFFNYSYDIQLALLNVWKKIDLYDYCSFMEERLNSVKFNIANTIKKWMASIPENLRAQMKNEIADLFVPVSKNFFDNVERFKLKDDKANQKENETIKDIMNALYKKTNTSQVLDVTTGQHVKLPTILSPFDSDSEESISENKETEKS